MIYARQVTVAARATIEVFDEIGISPLHCDVAIQVASGTSVYLVENSAGNNPGVKLSWTTPPAEPFRLTTVKDPVYVKNFDTGQAVVYLALTAPR